MESVLFIVLCVFYLLGCVALMSIILLQKKRAGGMGSVAGMGQADTYWDRNKGRSMEGTLEKWTKIGGVLFFIFSFALCLL